MKNKNTMVIDSLQMERITRFYLQTLFLVTFFLLTCLSTLQAQENATYAKPSWWFGAAVGSNFNFYRGSTHMLTIDFTPPATFNNGYGVGLFVAPSIEYYRPNTRLGFIFQAGYDSRRGHFNEALTDCNCKANLDTKLSYITIEPSVRFAPFKSSFYLYAGPRFAFNQNKSFVYDQQVNLDVPNQVKPDDVKGDFSNINNTIISMQIGLGYDIPLNATTSKTQFVLSPFASYHPYFGQNPRDTETWTVATLRAGFVLKFGQGRKIETPVEGEVQFSVVPPANVASVKLVREVFPLRNYIFFNQGDTTIPSRYVLLNKNLIRPITCQDVPNVKC
jgi:Outer membrane protein beta-barrel domain